MYKNFKKKWQKFYNKIQKILLSAQNNEVIVEQTKAIAHLSHQIEKQSKTLETLLEQNLFLTKIVEERTRTIEYLCNQTVLITQHQIDLTHKAYIEFMPLLLKNDENPLFNARQRIELQTCHSFATQSNDYINPESTMEGIVRPTFFVNHCIDVLGKDIKCLDIGTGAAGLVFEYIMNNVLAIGLDGSDYCAKYNIGYWPLLKNNLFHADITKPFNFLSSQDKSTCCFNLITMWEVLEHIAEGDLNILFENIFKHLTDNGYFIGSISCLEYTDKEGRPYHVTLKPKEWWKQKFAEQGLIMLDVHPFNLSYFCRGVGKRYQDFHNYFTHPNEGFHFVAQKKPSSPF